MNQNQKLKGIGASNGIAYANAFLLIKPEFKINENKIKDINNEISLVNNAIASAIEQIEKTKGIALEKLGKDKADVFEAHIQIANDPELVAQIAGLIKNDKFNGAYAINTVFNNAHNLFAAMEDEYFKQRASDVIDVKDQILSAFLNQPLPDILAINQTVIVVAHDLTPSQTALLDKKYVKGFATDIGGKTSHAALMAKTMEIPAVLGLKNITELVKDNDILAINGNNGEVEINPKALNDWDIKILNYEKEKELLKKYINVKTKTLDNHVVDVVANIGKPTDTAKLSEVGSEGIGLVRSEFLYMDSDNWPTEETQFQAYKSIVESQKDKLTIIRTLDIGGDKKLNYYQFEYELNPFLGYRAIRFCLNNLDIFKTQIKALLRASAFGKLGIMFPMIATVEEFIKAKQVVIQTQNELKKEHVKYDSNVLIGMMVEIPATVFLIDMFAKYADFFSIGTNDLIQYSFAADRMSSNVAYLYQPLNPALLRAIGQVIKGAKKYNKMVGMCGEMAGDIKAIPILLGLGEYGLHEFSMSANSILKAKHIICSLNHSECITLANQAIRCQTATEVDKLVTKFLTDRNLI